MIAVVALHLSRRSIANPRAVLLDPRALVEVGRRRLYVAVISTAGGGELRGIGFGLVRRECRRCGRECGDEVGLVVTNAQWRERNVTITMIVVN